MLEFRDIATTVTAIAALLSVIVSLFNRKKIDQLHIQINSRMDEWIETIRSVALAKGREEGAAEERKEQSTRQ